MIKNLKVEYACKYNQIIVQESWYFQDIDHKYRDQFGRTKNISIYSLQFEDVGPDIPVSRNAVLDDMTPRHWLCDWKKFPGNHQKPEISASLIFIVFQAK